MRAETRKQSGGAAGLLVLIGILTILGVTFAAGTYAGRIWATRPQVTTAPSPADREAARRAAEARGPRLPEPSPRLTFYQELTAPLTAPPPPPKPAKTSPPPLATVGATRAAAADKPALERSLPAPSTTSKPPALQAGLAPPAPATRFTIQVAAYRLRPPADALRATLVAAGHDARVVEHDALNGVRFRVQIGDFPNREAARDAAARLTGPTFVTTR
jgi:cell division protein FtsN